MAEMFAPSPASEVAAANLDAQKSAFDDLWYKGTFADALTSARATGKPLLVYWGAVWCPPCNALKSQVFSQPRFRELIQPLVAVYLDGDAPEAQAWGEKLHVAGYPTVLLLAPDGSERLRLATDVSMEEFAKVLTTALTSGGSVNEALADIAAGTARDADWRLLAYYGWDAAQAVASPLGNTAAIRLKTEASIADQAPAQLPTERVLLAARFLEAGAAAASGDDAAAKATATELRAKGRECMQRILADTASVTAARATIANAGPDVLTWLYPELAPLQAKADDDWQKAAVAVAVAAPTPVDVRLAARALPLMLLKARQPKAATPPALLKEVQLAAADADREAKSIFERHSVIADAADLLREAGDYAGARLLLDRELAHTDTPWYYHSAYARVEKAAGQPAAALTHARLARESSRGRASRVQWISEDLTMNAKLALPGATDQVPRLAAILDEYYATALPLPDGFLGRNATRAKRIAETLRPWLAEPAIAAIVKKNASRCEQAGATKTLAPEAALACQAHFASLTNIAAVPGSPAAK